MTDDIPFHQFQYHSRAFLVRATEQLCKYKSEADVEAFFYAALNLRFGIEARLNEYIAPALSRLGKEDLKTKEYVASKLLRRLLELNPLAGNSSRLRLDRAGVLKNYDYVPVTPQLASIHGQLGELLHHKFFANNSNWMLNQLGELLHHKFFANNSNWMLKRRSDGGHRATIDDFAALIEEGLSELQRATSGRLLSPPQFTIALEGLLAEQPAQDDA